MALPTTQKECTTRRIAALISGLWAKVKDAFQTKLPTTGTPSSTYSIGITGNASTSDYPSGFNNRGTTTSWGTVKESNGYTTVTRWATQDSAEIAMGKKSGALSVQIDGMYYQNEGQYQVLDTSSRGAANGVASLDANGKVPSSQLPTAQAAKYIVRQAIGGTSIDLNNLTFKTDDSKIEVVEWWHANRGNVAHKPFDSAGTLMMFGYGNNNYVQIANMDTATEIYWRSKAGGSAWTSWKTIPVIEHVTTIPTNPTVGTIYAL